MSFDNFYVGEFRHQLDEKCRLRLPSKLKDKLGLRPCIMRGTNHCLFVMPEKEAKEFLERQFSEVELGDADSNKVLRLMTSTAYFAEEDKQGRILMPAKLLEHAKMKDKQGNILDKNIVTIGAHDRVEIWAQNIWDEYTDIDDDEFDVKLAQSMKAKRAQTC